METFAARILVVDDKRSFRFMIKRYLEEAGFETACASGGAEALAVLQQSRIDLVLSDLVLLRQVRLHYPRRPPSGTLFW